MSITDLYAEVIKFHGHECPGAAFGTRVAEIAASRLGRHAKDNELVAIVEGSSCATDAIQVITGCTVGRGNLQHVNNGKKAYSFWRRADGTGIHLKAVPDSPAFRTAEIWALFSKISRGESTPDEDKRFADLQADRIGKLLSAPGEDLLIITDVAEAVPARPSQHASSLCELCGEPTEIDRLHNHRGAMVCPPCHAAAHGGTVPAGHDGSEGNHHHQH